MISWDQGFLKNFSSSSKYGVGVTFQSKLPPGISEGFRDLRNANPVPNVNMTGKKPRLLPDSEARALPSTTPINRLMRNPDNDIISVLILHEHAVVCEGLRMLIDNNPNMQVVGVASIRSEALLLAKSKMPNLILLDLDFDDEEGPPLLLQLRQVAESSRVLVLTTLRHSREYRKAVRLGARGLVLNKEGSDLLMKAIEKVHQGEVWFDRLMMGSLLNELAEGPGVDKEEEKIASLTERERKVISLVGKGLKNKQIAQRLFVCETTVSHRLSSVFSKLEVSDRLELVIYAFSNGLADIPKRKSSSIDRH